MSLGFFLFGWGVGFTIYVVAQLLAAMTVRGKYRLVCLLPLPFMLGVLGWTVYARNEDSNLWPIIMIFASPMALIVVVTLWLVCRFDQKVHTQIGTGDPGNAGHPVA